MSGNLANSAAEPSYITRLALNASPFSAETNIQSFFKGEQIEQRFNLLLHILRSSDKVGIIFSDPGVGKSSLLTQLQQRSGDDLRFCRIEAEASLTSAELISQCMSAWGADVHDMAVENDVLKNRLQRLRQLNIKSVLMIDNVDHLSAETLATALDLLSWQDEDGFLLQATFSANKVMPELDNIHGRLQRVDLPPLTEQELPLYLSHRLSAVGYQGELPFTPKELKQFFRHSLGSPAVINQLAHQQLLGLSSKATLNSVKFNMGIIMSLFKWLAVAVLLISLVLLLVFQDKVNSFFSKTSVENEIELSLPLPQDDPLATVIVGEEELISSEQAERDELASLLTELSENTNKDDEATVLIEQNKPPEPEIVELNQAEQVISSIYQHDWIMQQKGTDYTFQLMGSWQHNEVLEFIEQYALTGDVAEFESLRNGRVWYALVYGMYSDKQEALSNSKQWPAPLNTLPSWLRRFDSVQKQIRDRTQAQ